MRKNIAITVLALLAAALPVLAAVNFTADGNVVVAGVTVYEGGATDDLLILTDSTSESFNFNSGVFTVTNPGSAFKVGSLSTNTTVKSIYVKKNSVNVACATNPTPGTSAVTLPTTAADYVVYPSTNTNFATSDCCSTVANAATYNAFPTCGAATCNAGYSVSGASCVATSGGGSSSVGGNVGITTLGLPTPTPSPSPSPSVSATPTPTPSPAASAAVKLIRYANDPKVYVVENGQKRWVQTTEDFAKLGYKWSDVKITSASETYPDGTIMKVPSVSAAVTLIRYAGDPRVYVIENSQKRWVKTAEDFNKLGYKWGDVKIASASETYATGSDKTAPAVSGVLLTQALKKGSTGAQVKILQQKLKDLGYFPDKVATTTYFGNTTLQALKNFQKDKGLSPNGTLDVQTKALLNQ